MWPLVHCRLDNRGPDAMPESITPEIRVDLALDNQASAMAVVLADAAMCVRQALGIVDRFLAELGDHGM